MVKYRHFSDSELVLLLKEGNHTAFTEIYDRYFHLLYLHAYQKLADVDQAKDVVQEIFATLWFKREMEQQIRDLAAYLFTATRNKIFDIYAHEQVHQKHLDSLEKFYYSSQPFQTDKNLREKDFQAYIDQQIKTLPPRMQLIFELSRKGEYSNKEIAEKLETSESNVSKQLRNAMHVLKTKLYLLFI